VTKIGEEENGGRKEGWLAVVGVPLVTHNLTHFCRFPLRQWTCEVI